MQVDVQALPPRDRATHGWCILIGAALAALLVATCTPWSVAESVREIHIVNQQSSRPLRERIVHPRIDHFVVVAIDGVRWQDVFRGADIAKCGETRSRSPSQPMDRAAELLPNLHHIARTNGVLLGDDDSKISVSSPSTVSLPGYSELFSGRTPHCSNNDCGPTSESTLLDEWQRAEPDASLAVVSSWSRIPRVAARDPSRLAISAGRVDFRNLDDLKDDVELQSVLERGRRAQPNPGTDDYRPDVYTAETGLRILKGLAPNFLFLGLGDTDEYAHQGNYPAYLEALRRADATIGHIRTWLLSREALGMRTLLVVTTDHGRATSFKDHGGHKEAARIWMLWSGSSVLGRGYPPAADGRLADLAPTVRLVLGLEPDSDSRAGMALLGVRLSPMQALESPEDSALALRR